MRFPTRIDNRQEMKNLISRLCEVEELSLRQLSILLVKSEKYLLTNFIKPLLEAGKLEYIIPEMPNHPKQKYRKTKID